MKSGGLEMGSQDLILTLAGIAYGVLLVAATFIDNKVIGAFRLDTMFMKTPPASARGINLVVGLLMIGYNVYTMLW